MAAIERTEVIRAPIDRVFEYISHPERNKEWIPDVVESEKLTDGPNGPGSRFRFVSRAPMGLRVAAEAEIISMNPPRCLEFRSTGGFEHSGRWELEARNGDTCVRFRIEYRLSGIEAAILNAGGLRGFLGRHVRQSVASLKRAVEDGTLSSPAEREEKPGRPVRISGAADQPEQP